MPSKFDLKFQLSTQNLSVSINQTNLPESFWHLSSLAAPHSQDRRSPQRHGRQSHRNLQNRSLMLLEWLSDWTDSRLYKQILLFYLLADQEKNMGGLGAHFAIFYLYLKVCGRWLDTSPLGYFEQHHLGTSVHKLSLPALRLELPERHRYFYSNQGSKPSQEGYFFLLGSFPDQSLKKKA